MSFSLTPNVEVETHPDGRVRHLHHVHEPYTSPTPGREAASTHGLAASYLHDVAPIYGFDESMLELAEEKTLMDSTTTSFVQMYRGLPIWEAGFSVYVQHNPTRVTSSTSSVHPH